MDAFSGGESFPPHPITVIKRKTRAEVPSVYLDRLGTIGGLVKILVFRNNNIMVGQCNGTTGRSTVDSKVSPANNVGDYTTGSGIELLGQGSDYPINNGVSP